MKLLRCKSNNLINPLIPEEQYLLLLGIHSFSFPSVPYFQQMKRSASMCTIGMRYPPMVRSPSISIELELLLINIRCYNSLIDFLGQVILKIKDLPKDGTDSWYVLQPRPQDASSKHQVGPIYHLLLSIYLSIIYLSGYPLLLL